MIPIMCSDTHHHYINITLHYIFQAAKHFEDHYSTATPLFFEELTEAFDIWICKFTECGSPTVKTYMTSQSGSATSPCRELLKSVFRRSNHTLPLIFSASALDTPKDSHYHAILEKFEVLLKKFEAIFEEDAIVLFPTHPEPAPHYLMTIPKISNIGYTGIFNLLGFPATAIPAGLSNGLPIGIQAISGPFKDHLTIAAAIELDKVFGGWKSPCPVNV